MSIRDEILKHQGVLAESNLCPAGDPSGDAQSIAGNFGARSAEFGARKTKDGLTEVFFKVRNEKNSFLWEIKKLIRLISNIRWDF